MSQMDKKELQQLQRGIPRKEIDTAANIRQAMMIFFIIAVAGAIAFGIVVAKKLPFGYFPVLWVVLAGGGYFIGRFAINVIGGVGTSIYNPQAGYREKVYDHSRAKTLAVQGQYEDAARLFEDALREHPEDIQGHFELSKLYAVELKQYTDAIKIYRRAQQIPEIPDQHYIFAARSIADLYWHKLYEYDKAIAEYRRLIQKYPDKPIAQIAKNIIKDIEDVKAEDDFWDEDD